ncbi:MAG: 50S ribosomal protein L31 [Candidatus Magasanikbacteria bacterium CG10_big_fil_rev_8_21_14_0_10_36_32]|uniref:Large ribosomal subunit protein bL31 n=1 Tax=Candidatus Magasanikbacteria bacterium CG10_big_fil_rev_8_21_14_0_10_36_32 TaxID=1974646 RepID=A0A2M6W6H7_9BACT|nr:MAG: 50S ribosomal protein L31 [Candidatus Magasanikbacteria bacterium CG10_big_fil_rev_8_21_14_0_10_36_32]
MKKDIHPEFHTDCKVTCACGNTFTTGSTMKEIRIELCNQCHPFYTGKQKFVDSARRVEKFQERAEKQAALLKTVKTKKTAKTEGVETPEKTKKTAKKAVKKA